MKRAIKRFYATMSAAKYRRTVRALQRAYAALGEAAERAEFFDKEVVYAARAALARVPNALRVQACPACTPTGYNDGGGDGYTAYSCHHPQVAIYDMTTPVA